MAEHLDDSNISWLVGLNYQVAPGVLAYVSAATGFKSGDFNGSSLSIDPAEIQRQLLPVRPETLKAYEAGIKSSWPTACRPMWPPSTTTTATYR